MKLAVWAAVVAVTALIYWPALGAGFVGDDFMILHRLRAVTDAGDALRFFRGEFFDYYRPLAFVSHAVDWLIAGASPRQFHLTNLLLHLANTTLVFLIASAAAIAGEDHRRRQIAGALAALLFGLHASNHEAVIWMSARFDLLATFWALAALWWVVRGGWGQISIFSRREDRGMDPKNRGGGGGVWGGWGQISIFSRREDRDLTPYSGWLAGALFFPALLSKESVVALPIAAAAWAVFRLRSTTRDAIRLTLPWVVALVVYSVLRSVAGGIAAAGGAGRLPKLIVFAAVLTGVIALADSRWLRVRAWLAVNRWAIAGGAAAAVLLANLGAAFLGGGLGALAREKLAVAGFAIFYLLSPVVDIALTPHFLDPATNVYWIGGVAAAIAMVTLLMLLWRNLLEHDAAWFAALFLVATLIPISALTEGKRYVYLPSAAVAILITIALMNLRVRAVRLAAAAIAAFVVVSAWQISRKVADWRWAGEMTSTGARLVNDALAPACGGHVVFLTSPVAIRGVYTHFYYETFELPRGCRPEVFQVLVRVLRLDAKVEVRWTGPNRIVITAPEYQGNFVLSRDLRHFDVPLRANREATIDTPLGAVQAEAFGKEQRIILTVASGVVADDIQFFYYSNGAIRRLLP